jgi:PKD repeat protein
MRQRILIGALLMTLTVAAVGASDAGAVVVQGPNGRVLGITPKAGVSAASLGARVAPRAIKRTSANGNLDYNGGPVLHSSRAYLIVWDPSNSISLKSRSLLQQYLADTATDSSSPTAANTYMVDRQFTDGTGSSDYNQKFASSQMIVDTDAFPARDTTNCPDLTDPNCLTDQQLQNELQAQISAHSLPTGTGSDAPIYFIVTPSDTNICAPDGSDPIPCTSNSFCAYHSFTSGSPTVLYSSIPMFTAVNDPKACQDDGNTAVQEPNADIADVAIKYLSHEHNETVTDPTGSGWWDNSSGNEDGDNCNFAGSYDPHNGSNPNAFAPTLGGDAASGTLYNQVINGHNYYVQSEWSNGDVNCETHPTSGSLSPSFSGPSPIGTGSPASFDPSTSSSSRGYSSTFWDFGDGATSFNVGAPKLTTHTFSSQGTYTVKLTLVDGAGNVKSATQSIHAGPTPTAGFRYSPSNPATDNAISFDGSGSSDPNSGQTLSYSWDFGDGSKGSGMKPSHRYSSPGTYTVKLTVTDSPLGYSGSTSHQVTVAADDGPTAALGVLTSSIHAGIPASFDASGSHEPDGAITRYQWDFGDGNGVVSGAAPQHVYRRGGTYTVVLSVTDSGGQTSQTARTVDVAGPDFSTTFKHGVLRVTVDQGGTVAVRSKRKQLQQAGTVKFKVKLSRRQRRLLHSRHHLKLKLKVAFSPASADPATRTVTLKFKG